MNFRSAEQAVRFSYNISERIEYARSNPAGVRGTNSEDMTPMDLHAQAAMIQALIARMPQAERDCVLAMYARGHDRAEAIRALGERLHHAVREVVPKGEDVMLIVCHWATRRPSIRAIAADRGVSYRKVCSWRSAVLRAWLPVQVRATTRLHEELERSGITVDAAA